MEGHVGQYYRRRGFYALALLHPHCAATVAAALRMRRLRLPAGSRPAKGRPPLRLAPQPLLGVGLATGGSPLWATCSWPSLRASRSWSCSQATTAPEGGWMPYSRPGHPCKGSGYGWPLSSLRSLQKCSKNA
ncbi:hypothetical protein BHE74_00050606 [Ensete ventricosum]|nr:hypothetical protein BHE74_00050606 [Ensete ventricosum]